MTRRSNIVSFDDARSKSRRGNVAHPQKERRNAEKTNARDRSSRQRIEWPVSRSDDGRARNSRSRGSSASQRGETPRSPRAARESQRDEAARKSRSAQPFQFWADGRSSDSTHTIASSWFTGNAPAGVGKRSRQALDEETQESFAWWADAQANRRTSLNESDDYRDGYREDRHGRSERRSQGSSTRDERRRSRTKARADRMFDRQFGGAVAQSQAEGAEGAPRAAVYEADMGPKHRRSARMQRSSSAGSSSAKVNMAGWLTNLPLTPRAIRLGTAALCLALFCVLLYTPAQQYYQAQREHDKLAAEYSAIESRNTALDEQNDILASDAGMEDAVRQKYGYVKAGEQTAYVAGLSDEASEARRDSDGLQANVMSSTIRAPEEWYTPLLDTFFGVK